MAITGREQDILHLLMQGQTNKQIAVELDISCHTVRDHVSSLLRKCCVNTRTELVAHYIRSIETD